MKGRVSLCLLVLSVTSFAMACGDSGDGDSNNATAEIDTSRAKLTDGGSYFVEYTPEPDPIPHNELFTMDVSIWQTSAKETAVTGAEIVVDATMPAHGHGMNNEPVTTANGDGTFSVEGMKFHMQSETPEEKWVIEVEVTAAGTTETATYDVMCCGE